MALDRQSIEKRDFPAARRGYSPDAVDAHLSAIADEVEELRRAAERAKGSIADTAGDQVRAILEAAQSTAAQIRSEAEEDARRVRGEARDDVKAARASAAAQADEHVSQVSRSTAEMLERIEQIERELGSLFEGLRDAAKRINAQLDDLQIELQVAADAGSGARAAAATKDQVASAEESTAPAESAEPEPAASEPEPPAEPEPAAPAAEPEPRAAEPEPSAPEPEPREAKPEPREPQPEPEPAPAATSRRASTASSAGHSDEEGARLIALNMALNGSPREEIDRYLREHYDLADQGSLIDDVFASVQG